jgi:alginate O-acetyltransferase complex protein AlgI
VLFNSVLYLVFLTVAVAGSWLLLRAGMLRVLFLFLASCLFYMAWNPVFILLILGSTVIDFTLARWIAATAPERPGKRKALMLASIGMNLTLLGYFKYLNFFAQNVAAALTGLGLQTHIPVWDIVLPVGISFYTFQTMSYTIDVYRREIPAEKSLLRFALFSTFFPQLVAGPIVRAHIFLPQLHAGPKLDRDRVSEGLYRIARGLVKKVVVADFLAVNLVDRVFSNPGVYSSTEILVGLYAYTMQIYCDFSGYTDVAVGSAALLGYTLPENFNRPYRATSVADFWRRWHITLSTWLRYYVFFPLGGSRGSVWRAHRNTFITFVLIGLWHGANWTFVLYGVVHAFAVMINRVQHRHKPKSFDQQAQPWHQTLWKVVLTFHFVVFARILFRAPGLDEAWNLAGSLFTQGWGFARIDTLTWLILLGSFAIHFSSPNLSGRLHKDFVRLPAYAQGMVLALLGAAMSSVAETEVVPFIYFQF